jgi:hypothetical protein
MSAIPLARLTAESVTNATATTKVSLVMLFTKHINSQCQQVARDVMFAAENKGPTQLMTLVLGLASSHGIRRHLSHSAIWQARAMAHHIAF